MLSEDKIPLSCSPENSYKSNIPQQSGNQIDPHIGGLLNQNGQP